METRRKKLTKSLIDRLEFDPDGKPQQILWDTEISNLGIRIYKSGHKSFVVQYSIHGRWRLMVLDRYGIITLTEARKRARRALAGVSDDIDPLEARRRLRDAKSVKELCDRYIALQKTKIRSWKADEARLNTWVIPYIGSRKINSIDYSTMESIHARASETAPYQANRVVSTCSKMFNLARKWGLFPETQPNPCKGLGRNQEIKRREFVEKVKIPDLVREFDAEEDVFVRGFFWLALLTGLRRGELTNIKWTDFDRKQRKVRIGETKRGEPRYVPLSGPALDVIKAIPRTLGNPHMLVCTDHFINKSWRRIKNAIDFPTLHIHDIRRTTGSLMYQSGSSLLAIKDVLGHTKTSTTEIYVELGEDKAREAVDSHADNLMSTFKNNV